MLVQAAENAVHAARTGKDFGPHLRSAKQAAGSASQEELDEAAVIVVDGAAEVVPHAGGWLAILAGALAEEGARVDGSPVVERLSGIASGALAFAEAWGERPPSPDGGPSAEIFKRVQAVLGERAGIAMQCWFALPRFSMSAVTLLSRSVETRAAVEPVDPVVDQAAVHWEQLEYIRDLRRVLDDEPLLVLDRETGQGWMVRISGIGDNFQLHTLLGGALIGRDLDGTPPDPRWIRSMSAGEVEPGTPPVVGWWDLVDGHGETIWNEGVPADIPVIGGTRVVVLDPPSYERSWEPGRLFPSMPGRLTVETAYLVEDLEGWWAGIK
jgi:hypothetical protein